MATKTLQLTSGTTFNPATFNDGVDGAGFYSDIYGATVNVICWGAGQDGGQAGGGGACTAGLGGISGCIASKTSFSFPGSGTVSMQIPAANAATDCWFSTSGTVLAKSQQNTTTGCVGDTVRAGQDPQDTSGPPNSNGVAGGSVPGVSAAPGTPGPGAGDWRTPGAAGTPNYTLTAGGTAGPGTGGVGQILGNVGGNGSAFGAGGGGSGAATGGGAHSSGAAGGIILIYTPIVKPTAPPCDMGDDRLVRAMNVRVAVPYH